tara:strand:- start:366 stop:683 length:318 start_codon:yes stop_codon:yes gene_type:complete
MIQNFPCHRTIKQVLEKKSMKKLFKNIVWFFALCVGTFAFAQSAYAGHCGGAHDKPKMTDTAEKSAGPTSADVAEVPTKGGEKNTAEGDTVERKAGRPADDNNQA